MLRESAIDWQLGQSVLRASAPMFPHYQLEAQGPRGHLRKNKLSVAPSSLNTQTLNPKHPNPKPLHPTPKPQTPNPEPPPTAPSASTQLLLQSAFGRPEMSILARERLGALVTLGFRDKVKGFGFGAVGLRAKV